MKINFVLFFLLLGCVVVGQKTRNERMLDYHGCSDTINLVCKIDSLRVVCFNKCVATSILKWQVSKNHVKDHIICDSIQLWTIPDSVVYNSVRELHSFFKDILVSEQEVAPTLNEYIIQMTGYINHGKKMIRFYQANLEEEDSLYYNKFLAGRSCRFGSGNCWFKLTYDVESNYFFRYDALGEEEKRGVDIDLCSIASQKNDSITKVRLLYFEKRMRRLKKKDVEVLLQSIHRTEGSELNAIIERVLYKAIKSHPEEVASILDAYTPYVSYYEIRSKIKYSILNDLYIPFKEYQEVVDCGLNDGKRSCGLLRLLEEEKGK